MGMGTRRRRQRQEQLWISHNELAKGPGHPFYKRVNELLEMKQFDEFAEKECARFYAENNGRPFGNAGDLFRFRQEMNRRIGSATRPVFHCLT
jgi:transposase